MRISNITRKHRVAATAEAQRHSATIIPCYAAPERNRWLFRKRVFECRVHEHSDTPRPLTLLRARRERPCRRAADERDELATLHF